MIFPFSSLSVIIKKFVTTLQVARIISFIKKLLRKPKKENPGIDSSFIIPRKSHCISKTDISPNALKVLNRLNSAGYQAYLVGGSVRDLLLRKSPKDFDVATNATPTEIKKLFRNGRIIGRRFKLVHILFHREIIEVATFRSQADLDESQIINDKGMLVRDNVFGSLSEDAWRRDFTVNSLYYCVKDSSIIDYTGGVNHLHQKQISIIGDPNVRYQEDPVRMLRALRFCAKLHFNLAEDTAKGILAQNHLLSHVSSSRLFDEITKLYQCGEAESAHRLVLQYGFFEILFPYTHQLSSSDYPVNALIGIALENTDMRIRDNKPVNPAFLFAVFLWYPMLEKAKTFQSEGFDALNALEKSMSEILSKQNQIISIPKRFAQVIREIWLLQYRFTRRQGNRAFHLLEHPRFRAAYDFLAIRALAGDETMELADWWTHFQDSEEEERQQMVNQLPNTDQAKKKRRRKPRAKVSS